MNGYRSIRENAQGRGDTRTGSSWRSVRATATAMMLAIDITCRNVASDYPQPRIVRRNLRKRLTHRTEDDGVQAREVKKATLMRKRQRDEYFLSVSYSAAV